MSQEPTLPRHIQKLTITIEPAIFFQSIPPVLEGEVRITIAINGKQQVGVLNVFRDRDDFRSTFDQWLSYASRALKEELEKEYVKENPDGIRTQS